MIPLRKLILLRKKRPASLIYQGTYQGLLDIYFSNSRFAVSTRLLRTALWDTWNKQIRRDSDNDAVLVKPDLTLATPAISLNSPLMESSSTLGQFIGSNSGFVAADRVQTINAIGNFTQSDITKQPRIINAGVLETINGIPAMRMYGGRFLTLNNVDIGSSSEFSAFVLGSINNAGSEWGRIMGISITGGDDFGPLDSVVLFARQGVNAAVGSYRNYAPRSIRATTYGSLFAASSIYTSTNNIVSINNVAGNTSTFNAVALASSVNLRLGIGGADLAMDGFIAESLFYSSSATQASSITSNQMTYGGIA